MEDIELNDKATLNSYKTICAKLGLVMCVYYVCRMLNAVISSVIAVQAAFLGSSVAYILSTITAIVFAYIIPIFAAMAFFNGFDRYSRKFRELYKKPKRLARAIGSFPAMYGLGYGIALLTLLTSMLLTKFAGEKSLIDELFRPTTLEPSSDIVSVLAMFILMVVAAPIFEEFLVRGIMFDALRPYGCGMAIIISSVLFGLMHGSLYMLFYTTALGFALAYIRYATGSLFASTILHAIINSVSGMLLLISSLSEITNGESKLINTALGIYSLAMLILIFLGLIVFIRKIPTIRKYRFDNEWTAVGAGRKMALFLVSAPVLIMLALAANEHTNYWLLKLIIS